MSKIKQYHALMTTVCGSERNASLPVAQAYRQTVNQDPGETIRVM